MYRLPPLHGRATRRAATIVAAALAATARPAPAPAGAAAQLARGAQVADRFCYACHDRESSGRHENPLLPRLDLARFGTPERAYESVGRLAQLNASMTLAFTGSVDDRRALAAWLADAARREDARRRRHIHLALLGIVVAAAAAAAVALRPWRTRG